MYVTCWADEAPTASDFHKQWLHDNKLPKNKKPRKGELSLPAYAGQDDEVCICQKITACRPVAGHRPR